MKKVSSLLIALMIAFSILAQDEIEVVNIENQAVQDYMRDALRTYTADNDYRTSVITKYNNSSVYGKKLYWPGGKLVSWTPSTEESNIKEIRITCSEHKDYRKAYTFNPDEKSASSYIIRNLLPDRIYYYKVEEFLNDGSINEMVNGVFRTVGRLRMIQVRNSSNMRDLGGWNTQYGFQVRYGRLFRSASLERTNANGRHDIVDNLKITCDLDLRHEVKRTSSPLGSNIDYLRLDHGAYLSGIKTRYDVYVKDLRWIIARLKEGKNVDWHCAIGCDRCGTLSFLIEGLLGLNEIDLCRDYELSTLSLGKNNKRVRSPLRDMINFIKTFGENDTRLAQCFYNYWAIIGMDTEELEYFLNTMLDINSPNTPEIR